MANLDAVFNTFVSGSSAYSNRFSNHAYNVANAGVIAAKQRDSYISTVNSAATPSTFVPAGVSYTPTINIETIGGVKPTKLVTNFMINAKALVVVNDSSKGTGNTAFTKVTTFYPDKNGFLKNHADQFLQVVPTDPHGNPLQSNTSTVQQLQSLDISNRVGQPQPTSEVSLLAGLPGGAIIGNDISGAVQQQSGLLYDSKGDQYNVTFIYTKINSYTGANGNQATNTLFPTIPNGGPADSANSERWRITATATTEAIPPVPVTISPAWVNGVEMVFQNGIPILINEGNGADLPVNVPAFTLQPPAISGSTQVTIAMDLGKVGQTIGVTTLGPNPGNGNPVILTDFDHDGIGAGRYLGLTWDKDGFGVISYSNGTQQIVCRIPLAVFASMDSLTEGSHGLFYPSDNSGSYLLRFPQSEIIPSSVEDSTASPTDTYVAMAQDGKRFNACIAGIGKTIQMLGELEKILERS